MATSEFEFSGSGLQQSVFDTGPEIRRHEARLKAGATLEHQLQSIVVNGPGRLSMEIQGVVSNDVPVVNEVRLKFNADGQDSPVTISLCDVRYINGDFRPVNEIVAKVNTLTFRRKPGTPKLEVGLAYVKNKDAGDSLWQSFKGKVKGVAANLLLPPLPIETIGNLAVLDFGLALVSNSPTFTFPRARNLVSAATP